LSGSITSAPTGATTQSLHAALPISQQPVGHPPQQHARRLTNPRLDVVDVPKGVMFADRGQEGGVAAAQLRPLLGRHDRPFRYARSEEHTSELQSLRHLVCRLLLEK